VQKAAAFSGCLGLLALLALTSHVHKSLSNPYPVTPAMAAGVADHVWTFEEIAGLLVGE
jgi:hypothetical protein